jgi:hypothetical protein
MPPVVSSLCQGKRVKARKSWRDVTFSKMSTHCSKQAPIPLRECRPEKCEFIGLVERSEKISFRINVLTETVCASAKRMM